MSSAYAWLQRLDSNQRPSGYEPDELPLLYSGMCPAQIGLGGVLQNLKRLEKQEVRKS